MKLRMLESLQLWENISKPRNGTEKTRPVWNLLKITRRILFETLYPDKVLFVSEHFGFSIFIDFIGWGKISKIRWRITKMLWEATHKARRWTRDEGSFLNYHFNWYIIIYDADYWNDPYDMDHIACPVSHGHMVKSMIEMSIAWFMKWALESWLVSSVKPIEYQSWHLFCL